jgi:hypothetical protein
MVAVLRGQLNTIRKVARSFCELRRARRGLLLRYCLPSSSISSENSSYCELIPSLANRLRL